MKLSNKKSNTGQQIFIAIIIFVFAIIYLANQAPGQIVTLIIVFAFGFVSGLYAVNASTAIAAKSPVLSAMAKENAKTAAMIERDTAKAAIKAQQQADRDARKAQEAASKQRPTTGEGDLDGWFA